VRRPGDYDFYLPFRPQRVRGGIKAQGGPGAFPQSWWGHRWLEAIERLGLGTRLQRGRSYARRGQVLSVHIEKGLVQGEVQGSRARPYRVRIRMRTLPAAGRRRLARALSQKALYAARLLAGAMPVQMEEVFAAAGYPLFPDRKDDLRTSCSCPDPVRPCRHVAAVYYLLGEELDRDPFLLLTMRGIGREELVGPIGGLPRRKRPRPALEPLPEDPALFWRGRALPAEPVAEVYLPAVNAALPRQLGGFPFWRGEEAFLPALDRIYRLASIRGMEVLTGERE
jgi:uncharacterized Zn finger protein